MSAEMQLRSGYEMYTATYLLTYIRTYIHTDIHNTEEDVVMYMQL